MSIVPVSVKTKCEVDAFGVEIVNQNTGLGCLSCPGPRRAKVSHQI